jgi:hypothetical protein
MQKNRAPLHFHYQKNAALLGYYYSRYYDFHPCQNCSILVHRVFNCENIIFHTNKTERQMEGKWDVLARMVIDFILISTPY